MPDPKLSLFTCSKTGRRRARTYVPSDLRSHYKSSSISHGVYNIDTQVRDENDRHLILSEASGARGQADQKERPQNQGVTHESQRNGRRLG